MTLCGSNSVLCAASCEECAHCVGVAEEQLEGEEWGLQAWLWEGTGTRPPQSATPYTI